MGMSEDLDLSDDEPFRIPVSNHGPMGRPEPKKADDHYVTPGGPDAFGLKLDIPMAPIMEPSDAKVSDSSVGPKTPDMSIFMNNPPTVKMESEEDDLGLDLDTKPVFGRPASAMSKRDTAVTPGGPSMNNDFDFTLDVNDANEGSPSSLKESGLGMTMFTTKVFN